MSLPSHGATAVPIETREIEAELDRVLGSRAFARSGRCRDLLQYLLRQHLAGQAGRLKEISIALDVFSRDPASYDSGQDGIVRVTMARLRECLERYYEDEGHHARLRFEIPRGIYAPIIRRRVEVSLPAYPLIAVLPLDNFTADTKLDALCDGLSEDLIDALTRVPSVRVIARTSSFRFRGRELDARTIARELGADALLEGSLQMVGERLRITAQLILGADGTHLWSHAFEAHAEERQSLQTALIDVMTRSLGQSQAAAPILDRLVANPLPSQAANLLDMARVTSAAQTADALRLAERYTEQAIRVAPEYAAPWMSMASLKFSQRMSWLVNWPISLEEIRAPLAQALEIEPDEPRALSLLGMDRALHEFHVHEGIALIDKALSKSRSAVILQRQGILLTSCSRFDEAMQLFREALELEPFAPLSHYNIGLVQMIQFDFDGAARTVEAAKSRLGDLLVFKNLTGAELILRRSYGEALEFAERLLAHHPDAPAIALRRSQALAGLGQLERARELLAPFVAQGALPQRAYLRAAVEVCGEDHEAFFREMNQAIDDACPNLSLLPVDRLFERHWDDPRWAALMQRIRRETRRPFLPRA